MGQNLYYVDYFRKGEKINEIKENPLHSFDYTKRETSTVLNIGYKNPPVVMADFSSKEKISPPNPSGYPL